MNHITQIKNMKPYLGNYDFPINAISMAGTYDDELRIPLCRPVDDDTHPVLLNASGLAMRPCADTRPVLL